MEAEPWIARDGRPLPERLTDWDPATPVEAFRAVTISFDALIEECQLSTDAVLALTSEVRSDRTTLRVVGEPVVVSKSAESQVRSSVAAVGAALGGRIRLTTRLTVVSNPSASPLAAVRPGSELWASPDYRCALEGDAARFPTSAVAFSNVASLANDAGWSLDWNPDSLDEAVLASLRLLVNSDNERIRGAIVTGSNASDAEVIRSIITFDVARTLITSALSREEFLERYESYPEGSVGRAIAELIQLRWQESPAALAQKLALNAAAFEAEIQARFPPVEDQA